MKLGRMQPRSHERAATIREIKTRKWQRRVLLQKYGGRCVYCQKTVELSNVESPQYATRDHVVPLSKGGRDHIDNLALACRECNAEKGDEVLL